MAFVPRARWLAMISPSWILNSPTSLVYSVRFLQKRETTNAYDKQERDEPEL